MLAGLFGNTAAKAVDSVAGTSLADDETPMEEQPIMVDIAELQEATSIISSLQQQLEVSGIPQKVGLVEPYTFDPQVHFDLLTEIFGVYKGIGKTYEYECGECGHEWEVTTRLDSDEVYECTSCGDFTQDGDDLFQGVEEKIMTSREPTETELHLMAYGNTNKIGAFPHFMSPPYLHSLLSEHFAQLHGEGNDMSLDWGSKNKLHPLPKAGVVEEEEFYE